MDILNIGGGEWLTLLILALLLFSPSDMARLMRHLGRLYRLVRQAQQQLLAYLEEETSEKPPYDPPDMSATLGG